MTDTVAEARYLVAKGKRDEAIALLVARPTMESIRELDLLDAVDTLGDLAKTTDRPYTTARGLARRRRFDLLKPLLREQPSTYLRDRFVAPGAYGALAGLWVAPAVPDDSMLIRDWLVPATGRAWLEKSSCAQMLALLGDTQMARAIADELESAVAETKDEVAQLERMAILSPALHALGERDEAKRVLDESQARFDQAYEDDVDDYGVPFQDTISHCRSVVKHLDVLAADRTQPWLPEATVSSRFTNNPTRYGTNRPQRERWGNALDHHGERGDVPAMFAVFEDVRVHDPEQVKYALMELVAALPRTQIDAATAERLAHAAATAADRYATSSVILALAESGHLDRARALVADGVDLGPWRDELTARR